MSGIGTHQSARNGTAEWYTPRHVFDALGLEFDLDPCAPRGGIPWIPAASFLSIDDNGLATPWEGRVWLNPPYGTQTAKWIGRLADHGNGIALVFARTDTNWFQGAAKRADAFCFIRGRLYFVREDGQQAAFNSGAPSVLIAFGEDCATAVAECGLGLTLYHEATGPVAPSPAMPEMESTGRADSSTDDPHPTP